LLLSHLHRFVKTPQLICVALMLGFAFGQDGVPQTEQNAYDEALHHKELQTRIEGLESFLKTFPGSTLKKRALESLMHTASRETCKGNRTR